MTTTVQETPSTQERAPETESSTEPIAPDQQLEPRPKLSASIGFGMSAQNWQQGFAIAKTLASSALVPKGYQGRPEDIVVAMQLGAELGLPPMQALQSIAVINGKPGVYGDGFLAVIMSAPAYGKHDEYFRVGKDGNRVDILTGSDLEVDDTTAVSVFWRRGNPTPFMATFSIGDAKRAGLWGKEGPWRHYPTRMLKLRARGFAGRDAFAAELRGMRTAEELQDLPPEDYAAPAGPPAEPVRRSEKAATPDPAPVVQNMTLSPEPAPAGNGPVPSASPATPKGAAAAKNKKAAPALPPSAERFPAKAPSVVSGPIVITETQLVSPRDAAPYYEIKGRVAEKGQAPIGYIWLTESEALYKAAASCEGTDTKVNATWHGSTRPDGSACKVLTALDAVE